MVTSFYIRWNLRISNSVNQMWNADMISHFTLIGFCHRILWIKKPILTRTSCFDFVLAVFAGMLAVSLKKQLRVNKIVDWYLFVRKSADQFHTTKHFPFCHWVQHWSENRLVNFYVLCSVLCLRFFCWMIKESLNRFVVQCVFYIKCQAKFQIYLQSCQRFPQAGGWKQLLEYFRNQASSPAHC